MTTMTQAQKDLTRRALNVAGWPVRFTWVEFQAPGVNYGGMQNEQAGYWLCDPVYGDVTMGADAPTYGRPWKTTFVPFEEITKEQAREAAKVAERVAKDRLEAVANPIGTHHVPSDEQIVNAVAEAREFRQQAWAWNTVASCIEYGDDLSERAREFLRLD